MQKAKLEIRPFHAMRFSGLAGEIASLCCPPYDIIGEEQRQTYLAANANNIIRLELPRGEHPYEDAGRTLEQWLEKGILKLDERPGIYIYEEDFTARAENKRVKGFISRVRLEEFSEGVVLPHEETLSKAKADRFALMEATGCNFSQIYSLYFDEEKQVRQHIERLSAGLPDVAFTAEDGVIHRLWCVFDETEIAAIASLMAPKKAYIADGHHRYETALNFRNHLRDTGKLTGENDPANFIMMMLVDIAHEGLVVFPTHRIVKNMPNFDAEKLLRDGAVYFEEEQRSGSMQDALDEAYAAGKKSFILYTGKKTWTLLTQKDPSVMDVLLPAGSSAYKNLDVSILHTLVLERILGIDKENMANQTNLRYTRDLSEAVLAVDNHEANCAFLINPTRVEEIAAVAGAGEKMPQKSTYFYPKLVTGLVMNHF